MDGILSAALASLIISCFLILIRKSKTKLHAQIKFGIMLSFEIILFFSIFSTCSMSNIPEVAIITLLTMLGFGGFIGYKMYKTYLQIKTNNFPNNDEEN